jgi:catalase
VGMPERPHEVEPSTRPFEPSAEQWSPHRWTADLAPALVSALRESLGGEPDERVAHRHGTVWKGSFTPTGAAAGLSDYAGFRGRSFDAVTRFSNLRGRLGARGITGMATKMLSPDREVTDLVALSLEVFPVRSARDFLALLDSLRQRPASALGGTTTMIVTGQVSASALARVVRDGVKRHVVDQTTFHGVHTFRLVRTSTDGLRSERRPVRYRWRPGGPDASPPPDGRMRFTLELVLGDPAWPRLDDPTWRWPARAPAVPAGTLELHDAIEPQPADLAFNPLVLAPGIEPACDEVLSDRAGAYAVAHVARARARE